MKQQPTPDQFHRLMEVPARTIFATIVVLYGEKLANELAHELLNGSELPETVRWPRF